MDCNEFVEKCKDVLARKGEVSDYGRIQGYVCVRGVRSYEDDIIEIRETTSIAGHDLFEVVVHYTTGDGHKVENPCIMIKDGDMFRYHGDWRHAEQHIGTL